MQMQISSSPTFSCYAIQLLKQLANCSLLCLQLLQYNVVNEYIYSHLSAMQCGRKQKSCKTYDCFNSVHAWMKNTDGYDCKICLLIQSVALFLDCCIIFGWLHPIRIITACGCRFICLFFYGVYLMLQSEKPLDSDYLSYSDMWQSEHLVNKVNLMKYEAK